MKQKEIVISKVLSSQEEELINDYFSIKRINEIEGFTLSFDDLYNRYQGTYAYQQMNSTNFHAIYTIDKCDVCFNPYHVIINDRPHLYKYLQATYKLCLSCNHFQNGLEEVFSMKLDGDIAS